MRRNMVLITAAVTGAAILAGCSTGKSSVQSTAAVTTTKQPEGQPEGTQPAGEKPDGTPPSGEKPEGAPPDGQGPGGDNQAANVETTGVQTIDGTEKTLDEGEVISTGDNESTFKVTNKGKLNLSNYILNKASGEVASTEASDFYGANAGILSSGGATTTIKDCKITTSTKGGNAVFATGEGTNVTLNHLTINTSENNSRGLDATYSGTIHATDVTINTKGAHCAAVATDRGEGTIEVVKSSLSTSGEGSPCIYSTGNISATDCKGNASGSILAAVEGKNSITLKGCSFKGNGQGRATGGIDDSGVMVYQSMSGDAGEGTGNFTAEDSTLEIVKDSSKYKTSPMFFVTNTNAVITLTNTKLLYGSGILLNASGNSGEWGKSGENGGNVKFNAVSQTLEGDITADECSTIDLTLTKSTLISKVNTDKVAKEIAITIDKISKWEVTGDSYVGGFTDADTTLSNIKSNGHNIYYDANNSKNSWLGGKSIQLAGGGMLAPIK